MTYTRGRFEEEREPKTVYHVLQGCSTPGIAKSSVPSVLSDADDMLLARREMELWGGHGNRKMPDLSHLCSWLHQHL